MPPVKSKTVMKFGKIEITPGDNTSPFVPKNGGSFIDHGEIIKALAVGIRDNLAVLMIGESGTGKTSAIRYLASETKNGLRRVNLNGGTTADELVGRNMIRASKTGGTETYWVDGVLTEAMRTGEWIVLDEINAALPEVLFILQAVMDDDGYLVLNEKDDKEIVYKHPNMRIFATCNPPEYAGTKEMNKALLSRFAICINAEFPPEKVELEIIKSHLGEAAAQSDVAIKLVGLAGETRKAKELGNADYAINTRDILNTLRLVEFVSPTEALSLAFANKLEAADNKALKSMARLHLPSVRNANSVRVKVNNREEIKIGNDYVIDADMHNTYFGLTDTKTSREELMKQNLGEIIANGIRDNAVKGDEFRVEAYFFETMNSATEVELQGMGGKVASLIAFTNGGQKGKRAILVHDAELDDTIKVIENLYEIN